MGWLIAVAVIVFLAAVPYFAADSRDGADWKPSAHSGALRAVSSRPFSQSPGAVLARRVAAWAHRAMGGSQLGQHQHS